MLIIDIFIQTKTVISRDDDISVTMNAEQVGRKLL